MWRSSQGFQRQKESDKTDQSPTGILLHSRTVVEKRNFASTGLLSYAEGDIVEIEVPEYKMFELGDTVKLTVHSLGAEYPFLSTIIARDTGAIVVINPPTSQLRFADKRDYPRVNVEEQGTIALSPEGRSPIEASVMRLSNISLSGVGFTVEAHDDLQQGMQAQIEVDLGFVLDCQIEITRAERGQEGIHCGAKYKDISSEKMNSLRAFVLKKQVEAHYSRKQQDSNKRLFK